VLWFLIGAVAHQHGYSEGRKAERQLMTAHAGSGSVCFDKRDERRNGHQKRFHALKLALFIQFCIAYSASGHVSYGFDLGGEVLPSSVRVVGLHSVRKLNQLELSLIEGFGDFVVTTDPGPDFLFPSGQEF
jgi:hypothetical protein